jgi:hypothetical protein
VISSARSSAISCGVTNMADWTVSVTSRTSRGYRDRIRSKRRMLAMNFSRSTFSSDPAAAATAGSSDSKSIDMPTGASRQGRSRPRPPPASSTKPSLASIRRW